MRNQGYYFFKKYIIFSEISGLLILGVKSVLQGKKVNVFLFILLFQLVVLIRPR
jgi:hypothetical protein